MTIHLFGGLAFGFVFGVAFRDLLTNIARRQMTLDGVCVWCGHRIKEHSK